jgi:hypothetical protein
MSFPLNYSEFVRSRSGNLPKWRSKSRQKRSTSMRPYGCVAACLLFLVAPLLLFGQSQSPIMVTLDLGNPGPVIPDDFIGLSYETKEALAGTQGEHTFSASNSALIRTFR